MAKAELDPGIFEERAAAALSRRDFERAFAFADRRCRDERPPAALSHVLRADALFGLGDRHAALADIGRAVAIEPANPHANRRLLAWGTPEQRIEAALALAPAARNVNLMRSCARVLADGGRHAFATATILHDEILGWAYWDSEAPLELIASDGAAQTASPIAREAAAPLGEAFVSSARFRLPRPPAAGTQAIAIRLGGEVLLSTSAPPNRPHARRNAARGRQEHSGEIAIVVPVYGDYDATRACLASLMRQLPGTPEARLILIDDASPDPRIVALLDDLAGEPQVRLLRNARNLGFVGAVNRALAETGAADVILLNADTLVPPGFAQRLRAAAHARGDIGTVTPLSNNGELTSFPVPARANPMPSLAEIDAIDRLAGVINAGRTVELPNGIGFCLYLKRACLDAIGFLSEGYQRGYYEDVDWCLVARERGFRNVCATDVFVGHAGSRSFGREKRGLVLRNLAVLEQRFPEHLAEVAAFLAADPLRPARAALERALGHPEPELGEPLDPAENAPVRHLARGSIGVLTLGSPLRQLPFLKQLARLSSGPVIVLGRPFAGLEKLWPDKLIATGALNKSELAGVISRRRIGALVLLEDEAPSGHPLKLAALRSGIACAYLAASHERPRPGDLPLDPHASAAERAKAIAAWAVA